MDYKDSIACIQAVDYMSADNYTVKKSAKE
jgi:hypothetical protein